MSVSKQKLEIKYIRLDKLNLPSPSLRFGRNEKKFEELKRSIQAVGIKYPIVVRKLGRGEHAVVAGEQRVTACNKLGFAPSYLVPSIVVDVNDPQAVEYALTENLLRQELTSFEEANAIHLLVERYHFKQRDIARRLGKSETNISRALSIFELPKYILSTIRKGALTVRHGRALLLLNKKPELQRKAFTRIMDEHLSTQDTDILVGLLQRGKLTFPFIKPRTWRLKDGSTARIAQRKTGLRIELYLNAGADLGVLLKSVESRLKQKATPTR